VLRIDSFNGSGRFFVDVSAGLGQDEAAPTIQSTSPADGASGVATDANVVVTFSESMDQSATQAAFTLAPASGPGSPLAGTFSWSGATMTFDPTQPLVAGTQYVASVSTAARDVAGNQLTAPSSWSFTASTTATSLPTSTTIETGTLRSGTVSRLDADDNQYFQVNSTNSGTRTSSWYATVPDIANAATGLRITYRGSNSRTCQQVVAAWNWTTSSWTTLDSRSVGSGEVQLTNLVPPGTLADYVGGTAGSGDVRVRIRCTRSNRSFWSNGELLRISWEQ
jgi:hypothetical protein